MRDATGGQATTWEPRLAGASSIFFQAMSIRRQARFGLADVCCRICTERYPKLLSVFTDYRQLDGVWITITCCAPAPNLIRRCYRGQHQRLYSSLSSILCRSFMGEYLLIVSVNSSGKYSVDPVAFGNLSLPYWRLQQSETCAPAEIALSDTKAGADKWFAQDESLTRPSKTLRTFVRRKSGNSAEFIHD